MFIFICLDLILKLYYLSLAFLVSILSSISSLVKVILYVSKLIIKFVNPLSLSIAFRFILINPKRLPGQLSIFLFQLALDLANLSIFCLQLLCVYLRLLLVKPDFRFCHFHHERADIILIIILRGALKV